MSLHITPEILVAKYIKSATNRRNISLRLIRLLTLLLFTVWIIGFYLVIQGFINSRDATKEYRQAKVRLEAIDSMYPNDNGRFDMVRYDLRSAMLAAERKTDGYYFGIYYILICFIIPWVILRVVFWIVDAKEIEQEKK